MFSRACRSSLLHLEPRVAGSSCERALVQSMQTRCKASPGAEEHWLERHLPSVKAALDGLTMRWWIWSLQRRCEQHHSLQGHGYEIGRAVELSCKAVADRHAALVVDSRAATHLQMAAMAVATHRALLPRIRNEPEVIKIVHEQLGGKGSPAIRFISYFGLLFRKLLVGKGDIDEMARMQRGLAADLGAGFTVDVEQSGDASQMTIRKCLYHDVLEAEGVPHLVQVCCCTQDAAWFEGLQKHGLKYERVKWKGSGDECCTLRVHKTT